MCAWSARAGGMSGHPETRMKEDWMVRGQCNNKLKKPTVESVAGMVVRMRVPLGPERPDADSSWFLVLHCRFDILLLFRCTPGDWYFM
jgi:hypothetical protein